MQNICPWIWWKYLCETKIFLEENRALGHLRYVSILTTLGISNNLVCFLLLFLGSIRKGAVEVIHLYEELIFKLDVVKVKVTKPRVQYLSNLMFVIFQPSHSVLPGHCFLVQPESYSRLLSLILFIFCAVDLFGWVSGLPLCYFLW